MAAYISFGISASQLLSASVMAAPAALALSKLLYPETEKSQTKAGDIHVPKGFVNNLINWEKKKYNSFINIIGRKPMLWMQQLKELLTLYFWLPILLPI